MVQGTWGELDQNLSKKIKEFMSCLIKNLAKKTSEIKPDKGKRVQSNQQQQQQANEDPWALTKSNINKI
jgi:hypothetical protein